MNITSFGHTFFLFGGAILIAVAVLQVLIQPRPKGKLPAMRLLDASTIRVLLFVTFGILTILVGTGTIPMFGGR